MVTIVKNCNVFDQRPKPVGFAAIPPLAKAEGLPADLL